MKRLKKRTRADSHFTEARAPRHRSWDRIVYLLLLALFFCGLANYVLGDRVFLRADGLVLQNRTEIGAAGLVQITRVAVQPGQLVSKGDLLVKAESLDTLANIAELSMREAELSERAARLQTELAMAIELQPRAVERRDAIAVRSEQLRELDSSGLVTSGTTEEWATILHDAESSVATVNARIKGLSSEVDALEERRTYARLAIQQLKLRYSDGNHYATVQAIVGDIVPATGQVMNPGEAILTLFWGAPYVLAYLPPSYIFDVAAGDRVTVTAGRVNRGGRIQAILPMSTGLPDEFRNAFKHRETRQLARIQMDDGPEIPVHAAVRITSDWQAAMKAGLRRPYIRFLPETPSGVGDSDAADVLADAEDKILEKKPQSVRAGETSNPRVK